MTRSWSITTLSAALFCIAATTARAATITVDTLSDSSASGQCSLRDAITAANTNSPVHGCAAGSGADTILFASGLSGTITLAEALPDIRRTLSIIGPSTGITISGNHAVPLIFIDIAPPGVNPVTLRNLTLTQASYDFGGGAVNNNGTLNVENCTFSDNSANNGGAIVSIGTLSIKNSTFAGNRALSGGALGLTPGPAGRTTTVVNSTFYGNSAGEGGAIYAGGVTLHLNNSTFDANQGNSGSAIFASFAVLTMNGVILADSNVENCAARITDQGYNISDDASCEFSSTDSHNNLDPKLASGLVENGGPTETIALLPGSPAINQIPTENGMCPATDQREYARPAPGQSNCDIGAFELNAIPAPSIDCDGAKASLPNLVSLPFVFIPESVTAVTDPDGPFSVSVTAITQDKPVSGGGLVCRDGFGVGTSTAWVRANGQGSGGLIYTLGFTATDGGGAGSCSGAVKVCVQDLLHQGKCVDTGKSFDSTRCRH